MQYTSGVNVNFRCDRGIVDIDVLNSFPSSSVYCGPIIIQREETREQGSAVLSHIISTLREYKGKQHSQEL